VEIRLIWIGKTRDPHVSALLEKFVSRIRKFNRLSILEIEEKKGKRRESVILSDEGDQLVARTSEKSFIVVLDREGEVLTSEEFAAHLNKWLMLPKKTIDLIVGSFPGIHEKVKEKADFKFSFSRLTFSHELSRLLLAEQIYRAFTICKGLPYHK